MRVKVEENDGSQSDVQYGCANGAPIKNEGRKVLKGMTEDGQVKTFMVKGLNIKQALLNVSSIVKLNTSLIRHFGFPKKRRLSANTCKQCTTKGSKCLRGFGNSGIGTNCYSH